MLWAAAEKNKNKVGSGWEQEMSVLRRARELIWREAQAWGKRGWDIGVGIAWDLDS